MPDSWDPEFSERSLLFEPLRLAAKALRASSWPGTEDLNRVLASMAEPILAASGKPLRFVEQASRPQRPEDRFEPRIFLRGEVQFRARAWHDLFNALVWLTFPAAKAALNRRHYTEGERQRDLGAANRGPVQDALTLFDESGIIVAVSNPELAALLADFQWQELFWRRRAEVASAMRFCIFGQALYEKALAPFSGVTGRAAIVDVDRDFFGLPDRERLSLLDRKLAARINDAACFARPRELPPLPILGIPGWDENNARQDYYDDTRYFRPAPAMRRKPA